MKWTCCFFGIPGNMVLTAKGASAYAKIISLDNVLNPLNSSKNYMFNMTMDKFGYLTGRSLTTFKRHFKKAFQTTPQKWLTRKRLELAHYQIMEKTGKLSEV